MKNKISMKKTVILLALISNTAMFANITVTNVNSSYYALFNATYSLDLDNDAIADYELHAFEVGAYNRIEINMLSANSEIVSLTAATINVVQAMNFGDNFGVAWMSFKTHLYHHLEFTPLSNAGNKYVALRLFKSCNYYYGWVQLSVGADGQWVNIVNYAFEDTPQQVGKDVEIDWLNCWQY